MAAEGEGTSAPGRRALWRRLLRLGVTASTTATEVQRIIFVNTIALVAGATSLFNLLVAPALPWNPPVVLGNAFGLTVGLVVLALHRAGRLLAAAMVISIVPICVVGLASVVNGAALGAQQFLLVSAVVPFLIFPRQSRYAALAIALVAALCFIGLTYLDARQLSDAEIMARNGHQLRIDSVSIAVLITVIGFFMRRIIMTGDAGVEAARLRAEALVHNVLPAAVAEALIADDRQPARRYLETSVLFASVDGVASATLSARAQIDLLSALFSEFDAACRRHDVEKIKSFGDVYMIAAGVPTPTRDHAERLVRVGLELIEITRAVARARGLALSLRVGIHSGPLVAGIIGTRRFVFDLWGDTVNTAQRMQAHGVADAVQISAASREQVSGALACQARGTVEIKGKGPMPTYLVLGSGEGARA
ncbi:MAG: adenylate/guanylate cyclase domain-containing protein [Nannocystaceae bacterium]|nr:hypothetical protein [Myxococcales bacterium]